ncbi:hypothetical protein FN846DRAFT_928897 [Sphaerosporella brunnea]|uniref:Uncharacterized protein n=1 Tax=Sphaerosporella brunnea TaxID=1250544 RepID=A0A5J5F8K7_9PEZI|nr:hypothetical protein FN846DRAFT_928897 [Sphaerosporella brunnea]
METSISNPFRRLQLLQQKQQKEQRKEQLPAEPVHHMLGDGSSETQSSVEAGNHVPASPGAPPPTSHSPDRVRSKPPPPVVTPRKRASRVGSLTSPTTNQQVDHDALQDPFNAEEYDTSETEKEPVPSSTGTVVSNASASPNPFLPRAISSGETTESLAMSTLAGGGSVRRPFAATGSSRQSLDAEAFKQLMLTGQVSQQPITTIDGSNSSNLSSVSRRSVSEPIIDGATNPPDADASPQIQKSGTEKANSESIPVVSTSGTLSRSSSTRVKPPPPKPRTRSGGKSLLSTSSSLAQTMPSTPTSNRPPSVKETDRPLPPPPPPPPAAALGAAEIEKKMAPPPPVSRRQSTLNRPSTPATTEKTENQKPAKSPTPPPPPPVRRSKSTSSRGAPPGPNANIRGRPMSTAPPPPPPRRSIDTERGADVDVRPASPSIEEKEATDILLNLEKLQKEVDELRGKYAQVPTQAAVTAPQTTGC